MRTMKLLLALLLVSSVLRAEIRLTDAMGVELVLEQPAQRIVALAPHIVELVYAVGAGSQLVAAVSHSDYPESALQLDQVGSYKQVNYEKIAALKPDLVLSFGSGNGYEMINRLRALGFKVFVDEPRTLADVADSLLNYAKLAGQQATGEARAKQYLQRLTALEKQYAQRSGVSVFYQVWNHPLITVNDEHIIANVIRVCGGENVFADAAPLIPKVSVESVLRRNPQVIVASGMGEERPEWLEDWLRWPSIDAVQANHLYFVPPDLIQRHTPRILDGAALMCEHLDQARLNSDKGVSARE